MQLSAGEQAPNFYYQTPWKSDLNFYDELKGRANVLLFLRYYGCPVCQLQIAKLMEQHERFVEKDVSVFVVLQSEPDTLRELVKPEEIPFPIICDPEQELYRLYRVRAAGSMEELVSPELLKKSDEIQSRNIQHGKYEGNELQLPATLILNGEGVIHFIHYGMDAGDVPEAEQLVAACEDI